MALLAAGGSLIHFVEPASAWPFWDGCRTHWASDAWHWCLAVPTRRPPSASELQRLKRHIPLNMGQQRRALEDEQVRQVRAVHDVLKSELWTRASHPGHWAPECQPVRYVRPSTPRRPAGGSHRGEKYRIAGREGPRVGNKEECIHQMLGLHPVPQLAPRSSRADWRSGADCSGPSRRRVLAPAGAARSHRVHAARRRRGLGVRAPALCDKLFSGPWCDDRRGCPKATWPAHCPRKYSSPHARKGSCRHRHELYLELLRSPIPRARRTAAGIAAKLSNAPILTSFWRGPASNAAVEKKSDTVKPTAASSPKTLACA